MLDLQLNRGLDGAYQKLGGINAHVRGCFVTTSAAQDSPRTKQGEDASHDGGGTRFWQWHLVSVDGLVHVGVRIVRERERGNTRVK